jgi:transcriptional regulator with XRE-family HTH domain
MVQRRRLRVELRKARESAGLSQKEVAPAMDWSLSKLIRIETGTVGIAINDLKVLLQLYGISDVDRVQELVDMARSAKEPAWWAPYKDSITSEFSAFLSYESAATIIRNYESILMPGLLQTEEYARASISEFAQPLARTEGRVLSQVDSLVELRLERQERLAQRQDRPKIFFGISEAVLHYWVGGRDIMRRQLDRLKDALTNPNYVIWIIPFRAGLFQRMRGSYVIFELPSFGENEDVLYLEDTRGELIVRDDFQDAAIYLEAFWNIEQLAFKDKAAIGLVDEALARLRLGSPRNDNRVLLAPDGTGDSSTPVED